MTTIDKFLCDGAKMHGFRSGGGLRVVRMEKDNKLIGYGEHPSIDTALEHLTVDLEAGCRPYGAIYGKVYEHYLTGSTTPTSPLDAWLLHGRTFDASAADGEIKVILPSLNVTAPVPKTIVERARKTQKPEVYHARGYAYTVRPYRDGSVGIEASPNDQKSWCWQSIRVGLGPTFQVALAFAFTQPDEETP